MNQSETVRVVHFFPNSSKEEVKEAINDARPGPDWLLDNASYWTDGRGAHCRFVKVRTTLDHMRESMS